MRLLTVLLFGVFLVATQVFLVLKAMQDNLFERDVDPVDAVMERQASISDELTPQERLWLSKNHTVRVGVDPDFYPLEKFDAEGRYTGIGPDYLRILHKMTGLSFRIAPPSDWTNTIDMATSHKVDMYIAAAETQHRSQYMLFTPSYIVLPGIIVTRQPTKGESVTRGAATDETEPSIDGIKDLAGKRVAVVNRYSWHDFLEELHPEITPVPVKNTLEGLQKVAFGEVDAMIDYQFNITEKINNIRLLQAGLGIFALSGILYLVSDKMWQLVAVSALFGVGSGLIVPLSTGLISHFFVGDERVRQFGYSSAITNLTPNHLDYHKDFDEYVQAKTAIYRNQGENDKLILNLDDEVTRSLKASGNLFCTSKTQELANGVFLKNDVIYIADGGVRRELMPASDIRIPGAHNVYNMMMAAAVVQGYASDDDIRAVATTFGGVEHRIEFVREKDGVKYYNDSIASSPTRTIAGLNSFQQKVILIAGGYDKHIPYDVLGKPICDHVKLLLLTGATAPKIRECVENIEGEHPPIIEVENLETAVQEAAARAESGDVVIMSPASASFDRFKNFMERGKLFKSLVEEL